MVAQAVGVVGEAMRDMRSSRRRAERARFAALLEGGEPGGERDGEGGGGGDQVRAVFGMFLVRGATGDLQAMGEERARAVSESSGRGLSVQGGVGCRVGGDRVRVEGDRRAMEGADGGIRRKAGRNVVSVFREEASVGDSGEQPFSWGVLLDHTIVGRIEYREGQGIAE